MSPAANGRRFKITSLALTVDLGPDGSTVWQAYDATMTAFTDTLRKAKPLMVPWRWMIDRDGQQDKLDQVFEEGEARFREQRKAFIAAAQELVGSRLDV